MYLNRSKLIRLLTRTVANNCMGGAVGAASLIVLVMRFSPAMLPGIFLSNDRNQLQEMERDGYVPYYILLMIDWISVAISYLAFYCALTGVFGETLLRIFLALRTLR